MARRNSWVQIPDYEGHEVNEKGEIRNIASGTIMQTSINQSGVRYVALRNTRLNKYENRAVSTIVASTFCPGHSPETDTVLHLDGDIEGMEVSNLMWSSRYNAMAYHKEILDRRFQRRQRIQDGDGRIFSNIYEAARATGCVPSAIDYAIRYNDTIAVDENINFTHRIYPGGHTFRSV